MREITFTAAAREALTEEMERQPEIFVVGEGIGARGGNELSQRRELAFPPELADATALKESRPAERRSVEVEVQFARDGLHLSGAELVGIHHHACGIAGERHLRECINLEDPRGSHPRDSNRP